MTGVTIPTKNLSLWITIAILVIAQITTYVLLKDQVRRNTSELEQHNLELIEYKLEDISSQVNDIDEKVDDIFQMAQDYFVDN